MYMCVYAVAKFDGFLFKTSVLGREVAAKDGWLGLARTRVTQKEKGNRQRDYAKMGRGDMLLQKEMSGREIKREGGASGTRQRGRFHEMKSIDIHLKSNGGTTDGHRDKDSSDRVEGSTESEGGSTRGGGAAGGGGSTRSSAAQGE